MLQTAQLLRVIGITLMEIQHAQDYLPLPIFMIQNGTLGQEALEEILLMLSKTMIQDMPMRAHLMRDMKLPFQHFPHKLIMTLMDLEHH